MSINWGVIRGKDAKLLDMTADRDRWYRIAEDRRSDIASLQEGRENLKKALAKALERQDERDKALEEATELRDLLTIETKEHDATKATLARSHRSQREWRRVAQSHTQVIASLKELHTTVLNGLLALRREGFNPPAQAEANGGKTDAHELPKVVADALDSVPLKKNSRAFKDLYEATVKRLKDGQAPSEVAQWITNGKRRRDIAAAEEAVGGE